MSQEGRTDAAGPLPRSPACGAQGPPAGRWAHVWLWGGGGGAAQAQGCCWDPQRHPSPWRAPTQKHTFHTSKQACAHRAMYAWMCRSALQRSSREWTQCACSFPRACASPSTGSLTQVHKPVSMAPCEAPPSQPLPRGRGPRSSCPSALLLWGDRQSSLCSLGSPGPWQDLSSTWARDSPTCTRPLLTRGLGVWTASPWWQPCASAAWGQSLRALANSDLPTGAHHVVGNSSQGTGSKKLGADALEFSEKLRL